MVVLGGGGEGPWPGPRAFHPIGGPRASTSNFRFFQSIHFVSSKNANIV